MPPTHPPTSRSRGALLGLAIGEALGTDLDHDAPVEPASSGDARLDGMPGKGSYRWISILASGAAGTGKTTVAACLGDAACRRGERSS